MDFSPHTGNYKPLIINVALTGAVPTKERYSNLPQTPQEIASDVSACFELGARVFHIHMRDAEGFPTQDKELFRETISLVRKTCPDAIVCATTSSRAGKDLRERMNPLELEGGAKPEFASLSLGSFNFSDSVSLNPPSEILSLLGEMNLRGVRPELEVFEPGMVSYANNLILSGLIKGVPVFNILLGSPGASSADVFSLTAFLQRLPAGSEWGLAGIGRHHLQMISLGILSGGNVRVGMEDSPSVVGHESWSNMKAVEWAAAFSLSLGRSIASPHEARRRLGL
jgi:3-keto-5-aminohexanoate cleavage enzyme